MRQLIILLAVMLAVPGTALAGGGGGAYPSATEYTQVMNNVELAASYAQQTMQYQNELMQYQTMLQNLASNPMGVMAPDLTALAINEAKLMAKGQSISQTMADVDQKFASNFNNPVAQSFADRFKSLNASSTDALKTAMLHAGLQRENFKSDQDAVVKLTQATAASNGSVGAIQAVGAINAHQLSESIKLRDLISEQNIATNTALAAQSAKGQAAQDTNDAIQSGFAASQTAIPPLDTSTKTYKKFNLYPNRSN